MDQISLSRLAADALTKLEIKRHQDKFYAVLSVDNKTSSISETFNNYEAAHLAGHTLIERYNHNLRSGSGF